MELNVFSSRFSNVKSFSRALVVRTVGMIMLAGSAASWAVTEAHPVAPKAKPAQSQSQAQALGAININTADATMLASLNGIGERKAMAIIDYRKQHGPFKSVEQLTEVKGIGDALVEKNRSRISIR